jgi:hypothetical protein
MKNKKNNSLYLSQVKNLVRGALANLRASNTPDAHRDTWKQDQLIQQQINMAVAKAKCKLSKKQFYEFEKWVTELIKEQSRSLSRLGVHITSLGLLPSELKPQDLVTELQLSIEHLTRRQPELLVFANDVSVIAKAIALRDWLAAIAVLENVQKRDGYSYWAIELELALKQATEGVEALKLQVNLMSISTLGLNKFLLYFFGVRNEPAQTSSRFRANIKKRVEDSDISWEMQIYTKFRLYGGLEPVSSNLAAILAFEQLTTTIDLLFTLTKVTRLILGQESAFSSETITAARKATDFLESIISILGINNEGLHSEEFGIVTLKETTFNLKQISHQALQTALQPCDNWSKIEDMCEFIVQGLASQLSTRSDGIKAEELAKFLLNFSWLPIAIEIGEINSIKLIPKLFTSDHIRDLSRNKAITSANESLLSIIHSMASDDGALIEFIPLLNAARERKKGKLNEAIQILSNSATLASNEVAQDIYTVILANYLYENSDMQKCLQRCAMAGIENDRLTSMLPLAEMFQGVKWSTLKKYATSVDLAISLDHYLRVIDDRKVRTFKRYAVEELIKSQNGCSVIDLPDALLLAGEEIIKVEYLSYYVCDIVTLELLPEMGDSRRVLITRSKLLNRLANLHTKKELDYLHESSVIEENLQVNDGLLVLDDSKVYVDEQAILNYVNQEMSADFQRYLKLVAGGIGVSDSLSEVLKNFKNLSSRTFQIPKNDADDLLAEIVSSILERFLFDPASGLDIIIGRRIRHGTIASEIRGFLESADLIGQKPHAGAKYDAPVRISKVSKKLDAKRARFLNAAFSRFSESIDQLIALLRDEYFHVRSKSKPRGIFDIQVSTIVLSLARSIAQTCQTIDQFSKECIEIYWLSLSLLTDASRPNIETEIKKTLNSIFSKLLTELKSLNISDHELIPCLLQSSEELQRRAASIASWIRVPKNSVEGATYTIQRVVDVAVAMVTGQRPGFQPNVTSKVPENFELDAHGLSLVVDTLYIALDNICQHSGKKIGNNTSIEIQFNKESSLLSFSITNEVAASSRSSEKDARLNTTRSDIHKRAYGVRARLDRGSGLSKLAAMVMQSDKTSISFDYIDKDKFQLKYELVYVGLSYPSPQLPPNINSILSQVDVGIREDL